MGQRFGKQTHLEQAEAIFAETGADFDWTRTRESLATL